MIDFNQLQSLEHEEQEVIAKYIIDIISQYIPYSSTRASLDREGYPVDGDIEKTIRDYQRHDTGLRSGYFALMTKCGNCQDMAYAGALILRAAKYKKKISIGEFGINHRFLILEDYIIDPWAKMACSTNDWKQHLKAYGGGIHNGIMKGRLLTADHEELEDEVPEIVEDVPLNVESFLSGDHEFFQRSNTYPTLFQQKPCG